MSSEPEPNMTVMAVSTPALLRDTRWIAAAIWAGLLAALLVTSIRGIEAFTQGSFASSNILQQFGTQEMKDTRENVAWAGLLLSGLAALLILAAWLAFVRATQAIIAAYAYQSDAPDEAPVLADWLDSARESEDGAATGHPAVTSVLIPLGLAWAVLIMTPAILSAVRTLS